MWEVYAQKQKANSDFPNIYRWLQKMCRESQDITIARITEIDLKKKKKSQNVFSTYQKSFEQEVVVHLGR